MAFFAAIYHIAPRLTEIDWPSPRLSTLHFGLTAAGIVLVTLALVLGGIVQGTAMNTPSIPYASTETIKGVSNRVVPYIGINTIGLIVLLVAQFFLLANLAKMMKAACIACCGIGAKEVAR